MGSSSDDSDFGSPRVERTDILAPTRLIANKYRLGRLLGEGGMGAVYEAVHTELGLKVAIKILSPTIASNPTSVKRFRREARAAAAVSHDNVVSVTDTGTDDNGVPFIVMELLEGESVSSLLHRERVLPADVAIPIVSQILAGLAAAHDQGVVHRDLKPPNIFITHSAEGSYRVKILDFGISKFQADLDKATLTAEGGLVGTPQFMAPEQVKARKDVDSRADIYAVGVLLYRMLTGKLPFRSRKADQLYQQILAGSPPSAQSLNPDIPDELNAAIVKAIALNRDDRYPTARAFRAALHDAAPALPRDGTIPPGSPRTVDDVVEIQTAETIDIVSSAIDALEEQKETRPSSRPAAPSNEADSNATTHKRDSEPAAEPALGGSAAGDLALPLVAPVRAKARSLSVLMIILVVAVLGSLFIAEGGPGEPELRAQPDAAAQTDAVAEERAVAASGPPAVDAGPVLRFGIRLYHDEAEVMRRHGPLVEYLTQQVGRNFSLVADEHYTDMAHALRQRNFEFASVSAMEFVEAEEEIPGLITLGKPVNAGGVSHYEAVILARAGSGITSYADLGGKTFCFVSRRSTSGFRVPRVMLRQNGVDPETDFRDRFFGGDHNDTLEMLRRGRCDAGSVYRNIWEQAEDTAAFEPLGFFGPIPNEQYVAHPAVDPEVVNRVRAALLRLEEGSAAARTVFGPHPQREYFAPNDPSDHNAARNLRRQERRFRLPAFRRPAPAPNP